MSKIELYKVSEKCRYNAGFESERFYNNGKAFNGVIIKLPCDHLSIIVACFFSIVQLYYNGTRETRVQL